MVSRKKVRSEIGIESPQRPKTARENVTKGYAKKPSTGSTKWADSVLEKWRGALVKARLALHKKREKKKERYVKSTLARLRKIADAARKKPHGEENKAPNKLKSPSKKKGRVVEKAQVLVAVATETTSTKTPKKAGATSGRSQADETGPIESVSKVKRGKKSSPSSATDLDKAQAAKLKAEMERKEEVRDKWRSGLEMARFALQQKRERKKERARKVAIRRLRMSQERGAVVQDDNIVQVGLSLRCPSIEELRNFAKRSRY